MNLILISLVLTIKSLNYFYIFLVLKNSLFFLYYIGFFKELFKDFLYFFGLFVKLLDFCLYLPIHLYVYMFKFICLLFCLPVFFYTKRIKKSPFWVKYNYYWSKSKYPILTFLSSKSYDVYHFGHIFIDFSYKICIITLFYSIIYWIFIFYFFTYPCIFEIYARILEQGGIFKTFSCNLEQGNWYVLKVNPNTQMPSDLNNYNSGYNYFGSGPSGGGGNNYSVNNAFTTGDQNNRGTKISVSSLLNNDTSSNTYGVNNSGIVQPDNFIDGQFIHRAGSSGRKNYITLVDAHRYPPVLVESKLRALKKGPLLDCVIQEQKILVKREYKVVPVLVLGNADYKLGCHHNYQGVSIPNILGTSDRLSTVDSQDPIILNGNRLFIRSFRYTSTCPYPEID